MINSVPSSHLSIKSCFDLSSDHSPLIVTLTANAVRRTKPLKLHTKRTNCYDLKKSLSDNSYAPSLKSADELDAAVDKLNQLSQEAAWAATPQSSVNDIDRQAYCSSTTKLKILAKRKLRKQWQQTRSPQDKAKLNKAVKELKTTLDEERNAAISRHLQSLTANTDKNYSL